MIYSLLNLYFKNLILLRFRDVFYFWGFEITFISLNLIFLNLFVTFIIVLRRFSFLSERKFLRNLIFLRIIILILFFRVDSVINFYFFMEFSLVPVFFIVLGWGYQPERLRAGIWIFLYTVLSAIPFFFLFFYYIKTFHIREFSILRILALKTANYFRIIEFFLILGFLVKFPIYLLHIWLPRAHVEAPLIGSVVLAAVLLKLAGFGIIKFSPLLVSKNLLNFLKLFCLGGGVYVRVICLLEKDIKKLIAYSSVGHIRFVILSLGIKNFLGLKGGFLFMITHGIRSSVLFIGSYYMYINSQSRSLIINFRFLSYWPIFTFFWFLSNLAGIRAPPRGSFFREIFCLIRSFSLNLNFFFFFVLILFLCVGYSIVLFRITQYGQRVRDKFYLLDSVKFINLRVHSFIVFFFVFILSVVYLFSIIVYIKLQI